LVKPRPLAIFAEHNMIVLAIGLIEYLVISYGNDKKITDILDQTVVYIVSMMNPDGVEFDLSGKINLSHGEKIDVSFTFIVILK